MLNMSKQFYSFLSDKIIKYFQTNTPKSGDKYSVQFENELQVSSLYDELGKNLIAQSFIYEDVTRNQKYTTYELNYGSVQLIIAAAQHGIHPDFLATLRNIVGVESGYENKAVLFIHYSSLDSILGGAGSLSKEGMPLNIYTIERDILRKLNEAGFSNVDKQILHMHLDNIKKELEGSKASIFEYEDLIDVLSDSQITADEYKKFELFPDDTLALFSGNKLKARLEDNHLNYVKVSEVHSYGSDQIKLEKMYGESGAKRLIKPDWENTPYTEILKFLAGKKNKSLIEYIPMISNPMIWDREEGDTRAKSRIRNILVFADKGAESVNFTLSFTDFTRKANIQIPKVYQNSLVCENSGKKLLVTILGLNDQADFARLVYKCENAKFDFRIAVLKCDPRVLEGIKTQYSVEIKKDNNSAIRIKTDEEEVIFNETAGSDRRECINEADQVIQITDNERIIITVSDDYPESEENEDVRFYISTIDFAVPLIKTFTMTSPVVIEGLKLWYFKRTHQHSFTFLGDNSLLFGTKKYYTRDEFRRSLDLEKRYIEVASPFALENNEEGLSIIPKEIKLPAAVKKAFDDVIQYYKSINSIPSLTYINSEVEELYKKYLNAIINASDSIDDGSYLSEEEKGLFCLGIVKRQYGDSEILLSPLHPINVAYQLYLNTQNIDGLDEDNGDLLRKFQNTALLPYINIDPDTLEKKVFIPVGQVHSPEWKVYVDETLPRYKGSKDFVSKLVSEKIKEFVEHFSYLFSKDTNAPIRINLINTGDSREIVQGIIKYYSRELASSGNKQVIPIRVTMYTDSRIDNAFETMSRIDDAETLFDVLNLDIRVNNVSKDELVDLYRNNVYFYMKSMDEEFDYAHITFMEFDDDNQAINTMMEDIPSGVVMNGISSGVPSERLGDSYRTGFGTKFVDKNSELLKVSMRYNSINAAINGDSYRSGSCYALKMSMNEQNVLNKVYDASNWVTFINPKVDLNFFKTDSGAKELLIIHYSDQYNMTSSGYDAITVTKKSKQYQNAISRYLSLNGVDNAHYHSKRIINMFNALNGDWLLRMLSYKSHFPVEKLSILSAMKLAVKRYAVDNVIWVPVSLEEILRVSGSVGLSQSESIFSAKNLGFEGSTSDDLLLVGINNSDTVKITYYPIEIKIGKVESDYLDKGIKQAIRTREIFDEILEKGPCLDKSIKTRLYRNFFIQQILVNAEKMLLYEVGDDTQGWNLIVNSDLRQKLLSEDYEIVDTLIPQMGRAGVISFSEDVFDEREFRNRDVLIVEKTKAEGINLLARDFSKIDTVHWDLIKESSDLTLEQHSKSLEASNTDDNENVNVKSIEVNTQVTNVELDNNDNKIEKDVNGARVLIGKDKFLHDVYWEFDNKGLANRHLLITGQSGQGKTYSIQTMLYELTHYGISAVIFDYSDGFTLRQLEEPFKKSLGDRISQMIVYSTGVPINPFKRHEIDLAGEKILEKESDVAARLADIFVHVYGFGFQQYAAIFDAALNGMVKYGENMSMLQFREELEEVAETNKSAKSVLSKMSPFFHTVDFHKDTSFDWGEILYGDAKVNIIQLTAFTREMQVIITELMLWDAWYYTKKFGTKDRPFVVVLDEAQNLSHTIKSPSAAILTEGRKFGWSAWFATQSLKILKDDEVVRLLQAAFKLYFKPTDDEVSRIAKQLDASGDTNWTPIIKKMKKGQCIAVGDQMKANGTVGPAAPVVTDITSFADRMC